AIERVGQAAGGVECAANLKEVAVALHRHNDQFLPQVKQRADFPLRYEYAKVPGGPHQEVFVPYVPSTENNLRQLGLAIRQYHEQHGNLPPAAISDPGGKPLLSWRVAILPYLGKDGAELYKKFRLTEAWDSPHNKKLLEKMPGIFAASPTWSTGSAAWNQYILPYMENTAYFHSPELGMKWLLPSGFMPFGTDKEGKIKTLLCPADKEVMSAAADTGNPRRKHEKKTKGITLLPNGPQATVVLPDGSCSTIMFSEKA